MSREEIQRINARVLALWKGTSHGGIDDEEWDEVIARRERRRRAEEIADKATIS
jgi:hypothetical protein